METLLDAAARPSTRQARGRQGPGTGRSRGTVVRGFLGGHLNYVKNITVNRTAWREGPTEWTDVLAEAELTAGQHQLVRAGGRGS